MVGAASGRRVPSMLRRATDVCCRPGRCRASPATAAAGTAAGGLTLAAVHISQVVNQGTMQDWDPRLADALLRPVGSSSIWTVSAAWRSYGNMANRSHEFKISLARFSTAAGESRAATLESSWSRG